MEEASKPIAKPEDSSNMKNDSVSVRQDTNLSTPQAPEHRQLEEQQLKTAEVTFVEKTTAISITNSRRQRSRRAKSSGRTSEALSRDEQAFFMWEESQYELLFRSSELGADPVAKVGLTLASGRHVKAGESLDRSLIEIHLRQLREDLTYAQKEAILRPTKVPAKKERDKRAKSTSSSSRKTKSRRRDLELHSDSDSDNDSRSVSVLSSASVGSKISEASTKHSGKYATMDPDGSDRPMQSPIHLEDGRFIHRREHVNAAQHSNSGAVVTSPDFFRQVPAKTDHSDVTLIDSRRPFIRKNHVYPYEKV